MTRVARIALVVVLLIGTGVAIAKTEHLKLQRAWATGPDIDPVFSPACRCKTHVGVIRFKLTQSGHLKVFVVNADGHVVRTLVAGTRKYRHNKLHFAWNGRTDVGALARDGKYQVKVELGGGLRPITFPSVIRVDTKPPAARITEVDRTVIHRQKDPAGKQHVTLAYRVNERAKVLLLVNGHLRGSHQGMPTHGQLTWSTRLNGQPVKPRLYHLSLLVTDAAGNVAAKQPNVVVRVKKN